MIPKFENVVDRFGKYLAGTRGIPEDVATDLARRAVLYAILECDANQSPNEWYEWQKTGWKAPEKQLANLNPPVFDV